MLNMNTDANDSAEESVEMPSTRSGEGIEASLEAQSNSTPSVEPEENQDKKPRDFQTRFNERAKRAFDAERKAEALEQELAQLKANPPATQSQPVQDLSAPVLPEDLYDDEAMRKYHTDSQAYNTQVATGAAKSQFESQQQQSMQTAQNAKHKVVTDKYAANAIRDGVDFDKLLIAERALKDNGLGNELGSFLLNDVNGAKIVEYLSDNPAEMHDILQLDPVSAGIRIANEIKPRVLAQTPKVSGAPDPIPEVSGSGGYVEKDDFDKRYPGYEII